ncbi:Histone-lysine N-methyltransferase SETMAR [Bienertia sinuspersici]
MLTIDLNAPPDQSSSDDDLWTLQLGETFQYEWSNINTECDQVVEWYEEDSDCEEDVTAAPTEHRVGKLKVLKNHERNRVATTLLAQSHNCTKLPHGIINKLATEWGVSRHTIQRIWRETLKQYRVGSAIDLHTKKAGRVGRKRYTLQTSQLTEVPLRQRTTLRSLAGALNISKSTVHRMVKRGEIKSHSNPMKPQLTFTHKYERVKWCVQSIIPQTIHTIPHFHLLQNVIHVDEKWFLMLKLSQKYYLAPEECDPYRACRSKRFLLKIMFLAAVARPLYDGDGRLIWDGKIGIFPFTYKDSAKRNSKNRAAGTLETKAMQSISQEVMRQKFIQELLPEIKQKWPKNVSTTVWIQQDNAKPHIMGDDLEFVEACKEGGLDIRLINQPPQSPDLNVLDLGFFRAIQALKELVAPKDVEQLVKAVEDAFYDYCPRLTNHILITLHNCMLEILKAKGGNNYRIPHMSKERLERQGLLSNDVEIPHQLVHDSMYWLRHGYLEDDEYRLTLNRRRNQQATTSTQQHPQNSQE